MLAGGDVRGKDREYLQNKFRSGRFLMSAIEQRQLADFSGFIYGSGLGLVLGLRLVAMMLRSWLAMPHGKHFSVLEFQHIEVAMAALLQKGMDVKTVRAPRRRDRFHCVWRDDAEPL